MADCAYLSRAHEGENGDLGGFRRPQHARAFLRGGAGGEDVVDENEVSSRQFLGTHSQLKGFAQILEAFPAGKSGLARGGADPFESIEILEIQRFREGAGQGFRLIEAAFAEALTMEGDGNENGILQFLKTRFLGHHRNGDLRQVLPEFRSFQELEGVDELDGVVIGSQRGGGKVEARLEVEAVGAFGRSLDFAIKGLSALTAAGAGEGGEFRAAGVTQVLASPEAGIAENAKGRVEPVEGWRGREEGH